MRDADDSKAGGTGSFECAICKKPCVNALLGLGGYCSKEHKETLMALDREHKETLLAEPVNECPDELDLPQFERFILKIALHMLKTCPPKVKKMWMKNSPLMLVPDQLALDIKDKVLNHFPLDYVSSMEAKGRERLYDKGTYQFKKKVPKQVVIEALIKAHVFKRAPDAGDP